MNRTRAVIAEVAIAEVRDQLEALQERHLTDSERAEIGGRHPQTTAGFLAAKEALRELLSADGATIALREVELRHDERGAPRLVRPSAPGLSVSMTHTRDRAYGLAVLDEVAKGDDGGLDQPDPRA